MGECVVEYGLINRTVEQEDLYDWTEGIEDEDLWMYDDNDEEQIV